MSFVSEIQHFEFVLQAYLVEKQISISSNLSSLSLSFTMENVFIYMYFIS